MSCLVPDDQSLSRCGGNSRSKFLARHAAAQRSLQPETQPHSSPRRSRFSGPVPGDYGGEGCVPSGVDALCSTLSRAGRNDCSGRGLAVKFLHRHGWVVPLSGLAADGLGLRKVREHAQRCVIASPDPTAPSMEFSQKNSSLVSTFWHTFY